MLLLQEVWTRSLLRFGALYPLIVDGWHDPFAATDHPTYRAEYLPAGRPAHRIDYLLASGWPVPGAGLEFADAAHLSDHLAPRIRLRSPTIGAWP